MHAFHDYLAQQLQQKLEKHSVVVVYDERRELETFFDRELQEMGKGHGELPRVFLGERPVFLARYRGSFLELREAVEPIANQERPDPLILYVPGVTRDRVGSVLMELEKGGTCYEPAPIRRLALNVLRKKFTDGQIDEMLRPASVGYAEIVSFLRQGEEGQPASVLRTLFDGAQSEQLLARWIATSERDGAIAEKDAREELFKLIESRLGLVIPAGASVSEARERTLRYVLVGEFRSDLGCEPPAAVGMIPQAPNSQAVDRIRTVAETIRRGFAEAYVGLADRVEAELGLAAAKVDAAHLGSIDTFRFEEQALLARAGELVAGKKFVEALGIVAGRNRSFWVDRDVGRQAQWEACRLMAELGREVDRVRAALGKTGRDPARWVAAYAGEEGWHQVDTLQRRLETWVARMDDEPDERAVAVVRREHEELLKRMADDFSSLLRESGWTVPGVLHQTHVHSEVVQPMPGQVAYFLVDAMRYEMGVELARQLEGAVELTVQAAIAALPSITPVGMAALLPGAAASFSVVEHKGKLAARVEGSVMAGLPERLKFLKAKVPDAVDLTLSKVLGSSAAKLRKAIGTASLVLVRSDEIDAIGENDGDMLARQVMDTVIGNLARAVRRLAAAGIESFVISADHGHQFAIRKDDDMKTDNPGGKELDLHRRCWIGHGGATPAGTVRVSGAELGYDTALDFVFPTGLGVFKAGGGLSFHHGSASLQELVIPVLSLRMPPAGGPAAPGKLVNLRDVPDRLTNRTFGVRVQLIADLFAVEPAALRVIAVAGGVQVAQAGMAFGAELDRATGVLKVKPGTDANVGLMLGRDDCESVKILVLDAATDAVLDQSDEIPVKLGIG